MTIYDFFQTRVLPNLDIIDTSKFYYFDSSKIFGIKPFFTEKRITHLYQYDELGGFGYSIKDMKYYHIEDPNLRKSWRDFFYTVNRTVKIGNFLG